MDLDNGIYRAMFDAHPRPMWVFDRETRRFLFVNDATIALYGWSRDELLTMSLLDVRPPAERAAFEASWAAAKPTNTYARVGRHWNKAGELIDVHMEITLCTHGGREVGFSVATNVTGIAEAERRFRLLIEHSGEAIALVNAHGIVEYVSPAAERILGFPASETVGKSSEMRMNPDDVRGMTAPAPFETKLMVARVRHRDGSWRWIESSTTNLLHEPAVQAFVANYRDITARIESEHAMADARARLEYLLSATSSITYTARAYGDYGATFISNNLTAVMGYKPEDFYRSPSFWMDNIHPDDLPNVMRDLQVLHAHGGHSIEYRFRHADGTYRHMRDVAEVIRDESGNAREVVGYWIDVTEHAHTLEALHKSEANFRALIEHSMTAVLVQRDGRFLYANPAAAAMFGYDDPAEMAGIDVLDLCHPDDRESIRKRMQHTDEHGATPPSARRMLRRDGSVIVGEAEAVRLDFDGQPANVVFARDVTERQQMFARMALADRMLTVGTLAAGVAHEINNPLAYIATNLEILAFDLPRVLAGLPTRISPAELPALVADARDGVDRVSAIVRDLRTFARPVEDEEAPAAIDVVSVLETSIKMAANEIRHRAQVVESYAPGLPQASGHSSRLGQVFLNLLINAAQAIPEGRAEHNEIRVRANPAPDGRHVVIEVEDTGVGIAASIVPRIFDPFFTTKAPGVGMGLGLAISHQSVCAMGGDITVTSKPGFGTTFRITLPVASADAQRDVACDAPRTPVAARSRILLVDDEVAVGRSVCALLAGEHVVVPVTRARDALARIRAGERFDVILCDLMMPEVSGIELYDLMPPEHRQRIVFMTGGAFTPQAREFLARVDRPRIEKPFTEEQLRAVIDAVTRSRDTRPDQPAAPA
jgi:PAS domain S-box-containing protein